MKSLLVASVGTYSYDSQHSKNCPGIHVQHPSLPLPSLLPGLVTHSLLSQDSMLAHHTPMSPDKPW